KFNRFLRAYFLAPSTRDTAGEMKLYPSPTLIEISNFNGA
ncbi:unnamed protein product, partial [marine sediment metagenome]